MAVDRELRRLLECALLPEAAASADGRQDASYPQRVIPAREILTKLRAVSGQPDVNLAELLVLVAEAALHQRDVETAQLAVDWFLHDCRAKNQVRPLSIVRHSLAGRLYTLVRLSTVADAT